MKILYHTDIIPELTMAFSAHSDITNVSDLFENLAIHRIANIKAEDTTSPIEQVGYTIQAYLATNPDKFTQITDINNIGYLPELLANEQQKSIIMQMCANGRFIPFIVNLDMDDIQNADMNNIVHIIAGFGQESKYNFIMVTMDIPKIVQFLNLKYNEDAEEGSAYSVYPIMFDLQSGVIGSLFEKSILSVRSFVQQSVTNTETATEEDHNAD